MQNILLDTHKSCKYGWLHTNANHRRLHTQMKMSNKKAKQKQLHTQIQNIRVCTHKANTDGCKTHKCHGCTHTNETKDCCTNIFNYRRHHTQMQNYNGYSHVKQRRLHTHKYKTGCYTRAKHRWLHVHKCKTETDKNT